NRLSLCVYVCLYVYIYVCVCFFWGGMVGAEPLSHNALQELILRATEAMKQRTGHKPKKVQVPGGCTSNILKGAVCSPAPSLWVCVLVRSHSSGGGWIQGWRSLERRWPWQGSWAVMIMVGGSLSSSSG